MQPDECPSMKDFDDSRLTRPVTRIAPSAALGIEGLTTLAVGVLAVAGLYFARDVLSPITLAIMLSFLVAPLADFLLRIRLGHVASVIAAVLLSVSVMVLLASVIGTQLTELVTNAPRYQATIERKIEAAHSLTIGKLDRLSSVAGQRNRRAAAAVLIRIAFLAECRCAVVRGPRACRHASRGP
jgi:predicted PurR-regulated permease PerM